MNSLRGPEIITQIVRQPVSNPMGVQETLTGKSISYNSETGGYEVVSEHDTLVADILFPNPPLGSGITDSQNRLFTLRGRELRLTGKHNGFPLRNRPYLAEAGIYNYRRQKIREELANDGLV